MKERSYIASYDPYIFLIYIVLLTLGLYFQLSISSVRNSMFFFYRQLGFSILSLGAVWFAFIIIDLHKLRRFAIILVIISIILLIIVLAFGDPVKGAIRSIKIWNVNFQPSLLARIVLIFYFAHILDKKQREIPKSSPLCFLKKFHSLITITLVVFALIFAGRHLSILIISSLTLISMLFLARIRLSTIFLILSICLVIGIIAISLGSAYRSQRIITYQRYSLFFPNSDISKDSGADDYQIREGLISLTSGKLFGTGSERGKGKHYFLPEAKTDYIFAIIGEERGYLGALFVFALYVLLFARSIISSWQNESFFLKLLGLGLGMNIFFNVLINIGVAMAALPSTGVTLPFISYGGTSLLINSLSIGLLMNISARKKRFIINA
jgi:cell division protein FtsW